MANISASASKLMIDWLLGGATPTRPPTQYVGLSLGTPSSIPVTRMRTESVARKLCGFGIAAAVEFVAAARPGIHPLVCMAALEPELAKKKSRRSRGKAPRAATAPDHAAAQRLSVTAAPKAAPAKEPTTIPRVGRSCRCGHRQCGYPSDAEDMGSDVSKSICEDHSAHSQATNEEASQDRDNGICHAIIPYLD